jgi:hypothetical protein
MRLLLFALLLTSAIGHIDGNAHASERKNSADTYTQIADETHIITDHIDAQKSHQQTADIQDEDKRVPLLIWTHRVFRNLLSKKR